MIRNKNTSAFKNRTFFIESAHSIYLQTCFTHPTRISGKIKHFGPKINGRLSGIAHATLSVCSKVEEMFGYACIFVALKMEF